MAITANVELYSGLTVTDCYLIIPFTYVKKFTDENGSNPIFRLIFHVDIYKDATMRVGGLQGRRLLCRHVDNFKIPYDTSTTDNPWVLAYTHLKTCVHLSNVADA